MKVKRDRTEQSKNGELGLIIDEFGRAMWNANREYIAEHEHFGWPKLTPNMTVAWMKFVQFCTENPE